MKLGLKAKRNIGLIALTVVLVVAIILVIYFVQKNDDNKKTVYGHFGEITETSQAYLKVTDRYIAENYDGVSAQDGENFLIVDIEIKAKKKLTLASDKFYLNAAVNVTDSKEKSVLKKGQSQSIRIVFELDKNRQSDCYLHGYGANIDLCINA